MTLTWDGLRKTFADGTVGLDGAALELRTPCFVVLSGANGSGKTQMARNAVGLETPDAGEVRLDGRPIAEDLPAARRRIALVFQEPGHQILGVTVREDAEFGPRAARRKPAEYREAVDAALDEVGLGAYGGRLCAGLSGGEQRRLAIASALVAGPELVILDEPFNGLDWAGASDLLATLLRLRAEGFGILVITHDLEKCLAHADRLAVMKRGKVVADGPPADLWGELPELGLRRPPGGPERLQEMSWLRAGG